MFMKAGEQWNCSNPKCHCEVVVQSSSLIEGGNPCCVCGAPMKKNYTAPQLSYLEFLRFADSLPAREGAHQD